MQVSIPAWNILHVEANWTVGMKQKSVYLYIYIRLGWEFANGLGDLGSIPGRVILKTLKMVLDTSLHYKVPIKGKFKQSMDRSSALPYTSVL